MPTESALSAVFEYAEHEGLFNQLNAIYDRIPSGQCSGCTRCCAESVVVHHTEFLNVYRWLSDRAELFQTLKPRLEDYFLHEMVKRMPCPFLNGEDRCDIYDVRPLVCRQFGHWTRKDFDQNLKAVAESNRDAAQYYKKEHGIVLPNEVVSYNLPYCDDFKVEQKINTATRLEQNDAIFMLDVQLLQNELMGEEKLSASLVTEFVCLEMTADVAGEKRLEAMRKWLANT